LKDKLSIRVFISKSHPLSKEKEIYLSSSYPNSGGCGSSTNESQLGKRPKRERGEGKKRERKRKEKEEEEILLKKGVLLQAPPTPTILIELGILKGVLKPFNSSHFINHSHFFNPILTFAEFFKPISLCMVLNSSKDFAKSYFELMLPTRFHITQSKPIFFCEVGLVYFQVTFNNTTRPSSFVLYFRYPLALVQKTLQLLSNSCHHKFLLGFLSLPQVVQHKEQNHLVNNIRQLNDVFFTITPSIHGPFQIFMKINDNTYQLDLPFKYGVHSTFNISDLIPFVGTVDDEHQDLRSNPLQEGRDDVTPTSPTSSQGIPSSRSPSRGPIIRGMLKKIQLGLIQNGPNPHGLITLFTWANEDVMI